MKLSAKTRYGIAALTYMYLSDSEVTTLTTIAEHLNVSKLYLEQVFASLKQAKLVDAIKGPTGGYHLTSRDCNMYSIINSLEPSLFEKTPASTDDNDINAALCDELYTPIDQILKNHLESITLFDITKDLQRT